MRVERDRGEEQREGDDEHHNEQYEGVRRLVVGETRRERERRDAETAPQRDEPEVTGRGFDGAIAMHLERE